MEYFIRPIGSTDNAAIEKIIRDCLIEFGGDHEGTAWADPDLGRFSEVYSNPRSAYFVAVSYDGAVLGGAGIGPMEQEGLCELQKMYLSPAYRGKGIAQALLNAALSFATDYYTACYLETLPSMVGAQRFYEKNGFARTDSPIGNTGHFECDVRYIKKL